jgi:hypothetical protein
VKAGGAGGYHCLERLFNIWKAHVDSLKSQSTTIATGNVSHWQQRFPRPRFGVLVF